MLGLSPPRPTRVCLAHYPHGRGDKAFAQGDEEPSMSPSATRVTRLRSWPRSFSIAGAAAEWVQLYRSAPQDGRNRGRCHPSGRSVRWPGEYTDAVSNELRAVHPVRQPTDNRPNTTVPNLTVGLDFSVIWRLGVDAGRCQPGVAPTRPFRPNLAQGVRPLRQSISSFVPRLPGRGCSA